MGGNRYYKAKNNTAIVVSQLMKQHNVPLKKFAYTDHVIEISLF